MQDWGVPHQSPPEPAPEGEPKPKPKPEPEPRGRAGRGAGTGRGRRTAWLLAAALLVGVTGGAAVGYAIQAGRPPTSLGPLSQPDLVHPAKALPRGKEPEPLPVSQDHAVRTAGDLRKLIVPRPAGARDTENPLAVASDGPRYVRLNAMATRYDDEAYMFADMAGAGIRRVAVDEWDSGEHRTAMVALYQFGAGDAAGAIEHADDQQEWMPGTKDGAGNEGFAIKGSGNARGYLFPVERKAGYMPMYRARAIGYKGDVFFDIDMFDTSPIARNDLRKLAEQQVGRL